MSILHIPTFIQILCYEGLATAGRIFIPEEKGSQRAKIIVDQDDAWNEPHFFADVLGRCYDYAGSSGQELAELNHNGKTATPKIFRQAGRLK